MDGTFLDGNGAYDGDLIKSDAYRQTNTGRSPKSGGGSQSLDLIAFGDNNGTGTKETNAADDLRTHTDGIAGVCGFVNKLVRHHDDT